MYANTLAARADVHCWCVQEQAKEARPGETIYKGHHSYDLMRQLQLGILFSIAKTPELRAQTQAGGQPSPADFKYQVRGGSRVQGSGIRAQRLRGQRAADRWEGWQAARPA